MNPGKLPTDCGHNGEMQPPGASILLRHGANNRLGLRGRKGETVCGSLLSALGWSEVATVAVITYVHGVLHAGNMSKVFFMQETCQNAR